MKNFFTSLIIFHLLVGFSGCVDLSRENQRFADVITQVKSKYAPDRRTAIFDLTFKRMNKGIIVLGEVDNVDSKRGVIEALSPLVKKIVDSLTVLPDAKLGNRAWGIVRLSVANMRRDPEQSTELVTQAIMGGVVKVLRESHGWYYVQTSDRYLGWMEDASFVLCTREEADVWIAARKVIVLPVYAAVRQEANTHSYPVSDLVTGSLLRNIGSAGAWTKVELPDGRTGFVPNSGVVDYETWKKNVTPRAEGVERMARSLLGIPYLWGGTSTKAMDCSGFIKTVYLMNGMQLNRDANQQADQGVDIPPGEKFENLRKGDLLFFGRKENNQNPENITHEAMYLKDLAYIHCSHFAGMVKINSLDPSSPVFDAGRLRSFVRARRVIPTSPTMTEAPPLR
jgi:cell wall-associated NlpC family hydrolase